MTTYVDSSVLVAVYVPERFSQAARQVVRAAPQIPFTQLQDLEVRNACELLVGRTFITTDLSRTHTARCLTRSLDLLHVAAARVMMCSTFASADDRQLAVARAAGLEVTDIRRRPSRKRSRRRPR